MELDRFFGKGNWECISQETKDSIIYTTYPFGQEQPPLAEEVPGKFTNWDIRFVDHDKNESVWRITDHVYKISDDRYGILNPKRLSARQALTLELMNISFGIIGEDIKTEIIEEYLPPAEAACIDVDMSYNGGNPKPEFYDKLLKESWFNAKEVSADKYLRIDSHEFYVYIRAFDYRIEQLSNSEKSHLLNSLKDIEKAMCNRYGEYASFKILFDKDHRVEYKDGQKLSSN